MPVQFLELPTNPKEIVLLWHHQEAKLIFLDVFTQLPSLHLEFEDFLTAQEYLNSLYPKNTELAESDLLFGVEEDGCYSRYYISQAEVVTPDLYKISEFEQLSFKRIIASSEVQERGTFTESCMFASKQNYFENFCINSNLKLPLLKYNICSDLLIGKLQSEFAIVREPNLPASFIEYKFESDQIREIWTNIHLIRESEPLISVENELVPQNQLFMFLTKLTEYFGWNQTIAVKCLDEEYEKWGMRQAELAGFSCQQVSNLTVNLVTQSYLQQQYNNGLQFSFKNYQQQAVVGFFDISPFFREEINCFKAELHEHANRRVFVAAEAAKLERLMIYSDELQMNYIRVYSGYCVQDLRCVFQAHCNFYNEQFLTVNLEEMVEILVIDTTCSDSYEVVGFGENLTESYYTLSSNENSVELLYELQSVLPEPNDHQILEEEFLLFDKYFRPNAANYAKSRQKELQDVLYKLQSSGNEALFNQFSCKWDFLQHSNSAISIKADNKKSTNFVNSILKYSHIIPISELDNRELSPYDYKPLPHGIVILFASNDINRLFTNEANKIDYIANCQLLQITLISLHKSIAFHVYELKDTEISIFHGNQYIEQNNGIYTIDNVNEPLVFKLTSQKEIELNRISVQGRNYEKFAEEKVKPIILKLTLLKCEEYNKSPFVAIKFKSFVNTEAISIKVTSTCCVRIYVKQPTQEDIEPSFFKEFSNTNCAGTLNLQDNELHIIHCNESGIFKLELSKVVRLVILCSEMTEIQFFGDAL